MCGMRGWCPAEGDGDRQRLRCHVDRFRLARDGVLGAVDHAWFERGDDRFRTSCLGFETPG